MTLCSSVGFAKVGVSPLLVWPTRRSRCEAGYFLTTVLVENCFRGLAMQADEQGYRLDQVEMLCEVNLRLSLGLSDGDLLRFTAE